MTPTTYVVGRTAAEAQDWIRFRLDWEKERRRFVAVNSRRAIVGRQLFADDRLELVGTWWRRSDIRAIVEEFYRSAHKERPRQIVTVTRPLVEDWAQQDARRVRDRRTT